MEIDGVRFGWKAIEDQYNRDRIRTDQGCAPRVPCLRYNFVYRDIWTGLDVQPAKIMQLQEILLGIVFPFKVNTCLFNEL